MKALAVWLMVPSCSKHNLVCWLKPCVYEGKPRTLEELKSVIRNWIEEIVEERPETMEEIYGQYLNDIIFCI